MKLYELKHINDAPTVNKLTQQLFQGLLLGASLIICIEAVKYWFGA